MGEPFVALSSDFLDLNLCRGGEAARHMAQKWEQNATVVKYALDNATVNDEVIKAVLQMAAELPEEPTADQMLLLQVCETNDHEVSVALRQLHSYGAA